MYFCQIFVSQNCLPDERRALKNALPDGNLALKITYPTRIWPSFLADMILLSISFVQTTIPDMKF